MVNTSGLARCPFALGSIRFCRFSFALSHFFLSPLLLLIYSRKSLHFSAKTDYLPIVVLRLWHGCLFAQCIRVCVCVCLRKYATTSATSKHDCWYKAEGTRTCKCEMANFSRRELDSFYTFCSPSLVPPFNPAYPPFLFLFHSLIPPPTFSYDFFSLFLRSCCSSPLPFARPRLEKISLEEFKRK